MNLAQLEKASRAQSQITALLEGLRAAKMLCNEWNLNDLPISEQVENLFNEVRDLRLPDTPA